MKRVLFALLLLAAPAQASPVVADISTYRVSIDADFTGIRLFIFGARNEIGDVVVVIRGPEKNYVVRKKDRVMGVWVNRHQLTFNQVPDFYAVASSRPLEEMESSSLLENIQLSAPRLRVPEKEKKRELYPEFSQAFFAHQRERRLYPSLLPLTFMGETLFKTVIPFPDTISRGDYTAEIYLLSDGEIVGMHVMPIKVEKTGLDAAIYDMAHQRPALYGLLAITLALAAGWVAQRVFRIRK